MITPRRICYCTEIQVSLFFSEYQRGPAAEECLNQQKGASTHLDILKAEPSATDAPRERRDVHLLDNCCSLAISDAPSCSSRLQTLRLCSPSIPPAASSAIPRRRVAAHAAFPRSRDTERRLNSYEAEGARMPEVEGCVRPPPPPRN